MGTEGIYIPLILAAVGAATTAYTQKQAADKQDNQLSASLRAQRDKQHEADQKTNALIAQQGNVDDSKQKGSSLAAFTQAIQQNQGNAVNPLNQVGNVSDAYKKAGSDAVLGINKTGGNFADLVSSIDAPGQQRRDNIKNLDDYNSDINLIKRRNQGDDFLNQMRLRGIQPNPYGMLAGGLLSGAGKGIASGGGSYGTSAGGSTSGYDMYGSPSGTDAYNLYGYH